MRRKTRQTLGVLALAASTLALGGNAQPQKLRYRIDAQHSDVHARVGFFGIASKTARFPAIAGGIELNPAHLDSVKLDVTLDATALDAGDTVTLKRLKGPDFFDVEHHPQVRFVGRSMTMTGPVTAVVNGDLTAKGVTRPTTLNISFTAPPAKATGRDAIRLSGRTRIDRTEFGMIAYRLIVAKSVTISIDTQMVPA